MSGYPAKPSSLAFDDTGTLLATGGGEAVTVWSFQGSGPEGTRPGVLEFHVQPVTRRFPSLPARCAWHREAAMGPWLCGRFREMEKAIRQGSRLWRAQWPNCTGGQMDVRLPRSTRWVA